MRSWVLDLFEIVLNYTWGNTLNPDNGLEIAH